MRIPGDPQKSVFQRHSPPRRTQEGAAAPTDQFQWSGSDLREASVEKARESTLRKVALSLGATASLAGAVTGQPAAAQEVVSAHNLSELPTNLAKAEEIAPGTLILSDFFDDRTGPAHGIIVENSSRDVGFQNSILRHEAPRNESNVIADRYFSRLDNRDFTPEALREFTYDYVLNRQMGNLQSATDELQQLIDRDVRQSVLNLSRGSGKAQIMESLYERLNMAWDQSAYPQAATIGQRRVRKLAPALGLDAETVLKGEGDSRAVFQRKILELIDQATADERVVNAQASYDSAVEKFEANGNSVVVAAANSGKVLRLLERDASNVEVAPDFFRNLLANDQVTTVGATRSVGGEQVIADYTNPDSGIDIYANGLQDNVEGTSYATPRVGSVMAELHKLNPSASSAEVEQMLKDGYAEELTDYGAWQRAPVLRESQSRDWLMGK